MNSRTIEGFLPSTHGFHYANAWPSGPTVRFGPLDPRWIGIGDAADGLCGGMVYTVGDLFLAGVAMGADREPPANGSPHFRAIVRRQVESLAFLTVPVRYWLRSALGGSLGGDRARGTLDREWPKAKALLDAGRVAMIGLIRVASANPMSLTRNHQVMAWGYAEDGRGVTLRLYDPNWPDRDDVTITIHLDPALRPSGLSQSTGEPLLGWFVLPYSPADPHAWR
ncbi:MAG TPA: hypothetical protein VFY18_03345 [Candidatus Limnocylindrales bacterium]|nr:hypothetical protein [Candidatus Limnocylindrales bacterium]